MGLNVFSFFEKPRSQVADMTDMNNLFPVFGVSFFVLGALGVCLGILFRGGPSRVKTGKDNEAQTAQIDQNLQSLKTYVMQKDLEIQDLIKKTKDLEKKLAGELPALKEETVHFDKAFKNFSEKIEAAAKTTVEIEKKTATDLSAVNEKLLERQNEIQSIRKLVQDAESRIKADFDNLKGKIESSGSLSKPVAVTAPAIAAKAAEPVPAVSQSPAPAKTGTSTGSIAAQTVPTPLPPKVEVSQPELPKTETPKPESVKVEPLKTETPKLESPKMEVSRSEISKTGSPVPEPSGAESSLPKPESPKPEPAKAEPPKTVSVAPPSGENKDPKPADQNTVEDILSNLKKKSN